MRPTVTNPNCPACLRPLQFRTFQSCAWCGHAIPAALWFPVEQIAETDARASIVKNAPAAMSAQSKGGLASGSADVGDVIDAIGVAIDLSDLF
ncbi:MAG: hypothetical protein NTY70_05910 [Burkholderiales bacterium]|nr:hypothetical protein [Burkholderiales bacterium]